MKDLKLTKELIGYFDVRQYIAKKDKKECPILPETSNIKFVFTTSIEDIEDDLKKYARLYTSKNGEQRYAVQFKIGKFCKWYDERGVETDKPVNPELASSCYRVVLQYATLDGNPALKEASGYWVNAIQFQRVEINPFKSLKNAESISCNQNTIEEQKNVAKKDTCDEKVKKNVEKNVLLQSNDNEEDEEDSFKLPW